MIVAVVAMGVVQVTLHDIVRVIAVRDRFVSAAGAVMVLLRVAVVEAWRAARGVLGVHAYLVVFGAPTLLMLQVAMIQVVDVALVLHRVVSA
jgi:hypothetical protein